MQDHGVAAPDPRSCSEAGQAVLTGQGLRVFSF